MKEWEKGSCEIREEDQRRREKLAGHLERMNVKGKRRRKTSCRLTERTIRSICLSRFELFFEISNEVEISIYIDRSTECEEH